MPRIEQNRGGYREKKRHRSSQALFLDALIELHGGPQKFADKIGIHPQQAINWRLRGVVPPKMIGKVSRALRISPWGLNYEFLYDLGVTIPTWSFVVTNAFADTDTRNRIFKGKHPSG